MKRPFGFVQAYYIQEDAMKKGASTDPDERMK
jgi:hypothetical protein